MTIEKVIQLIGAASLLLVLLRVCVGSAALLRSEWGHWRRRRETLRKFQPRRTRSSTARPNNLSTWQGRRKFRVVRREYETADGQVCSFHLAPLDRKALPSYLPGQYLMFDVPAGPDGRAMKRNYSLSEAPPPSGPPSEYRVTVKRLDAPHDAPVGTPPGMGSHYFHALDENAIVDVYAPGGQFTLDSSSERPVVFVAGGVGITPIISMLHWVLRAQPQREVWLFYGVRNRAEHIMISHLQMLRETQNNLRCLNFYSRPTEECRIGIDYDVEGHITVNHLSAVLQGGDYQFYVCGPDGMMQTVLADLAHWGVPQSDIFFESFGSRRPPSDVFEAEADDAADAVPVTIEFARSRKRARWTAKADSLLELAELNGINVRYGCRAGGCGTCETQVLQGEVTYTQRPVVQPKPGHCLACIARPRGDVVLNV